MQAFIVHTCAVLSDNALKHMLVIRISMMGPHLQRGCCILAAGISESVLGLQAIGSLCHSWHVRPLISARIITLHVMIQHV
jgi:hypothetical protein